MCGRFALAVHTVLELEDFFGGFMLSELPELPQYNICPTQTVVSVVSHEGQRQLVSMRWGFLPHWYKRPNDVPLLINARSETIAEKPAFRTACRNRRCLIPATGFYEWTKTSDQERLPWYAYSKREPVFAFAGVWQTWEGEGMRMDTCAVVTTTANKSMSKVHHRMPVVINREDHGLWLGEAGKGAATLMRAAREDFFEVHRVGIEVNSNRSEGPRLIEPLQ